MNLSSPPQRFRARILENRPLGGNLHGLVLDAAAIAGLVQPGHFVQLDCHSSLTLLRPFSIMDADAEKGTVEILYQVVGVGTKFMQQWQTGQEAWVFGPLGSCFTATRKVHGALLVAGGVGLAPLRFLARRLQNLGVAVTILWGLEAEVVPFATVSAILPQPGEQIENPLALAWEESHGIVTRLASIKKRQGFYHGLVSELLEQILGGIGGSLPHLYVCGPTAMMVAVADVAKKWDLKGEVSLEGHMACGFGGCAGCAVPVYQGEGWHYVRSCTEGPVLPLDQVLWQTPGIKADGCNTKGGKGSCL
ncbi:MAG: dihydroorotate oxidase B, electron transfer subunit [Magnetococcales bacterium]|nr:dihydroorotate oxidase B, electron transfer subunit [Magnetococcales bacterium]HIJ84147.1 dihydroorotate dehydrogenase electron transfer subunit [Magnetococcales bacterium]